ncbi:MAG: ABC transporter ATP-binding protein [Clostridia bacterium]|nr:ABC transporter ATP-binding protein [Clostridia bacterium]
MGPGATEKAKNFKVAIKRLFGELKNYRILIVIALILAVLSSVLSIFAPNKLSDLTDEISEGLVVNKDNLEILSSKIQENMKEGIFKLQLSSSQLPIETLDENLTGIQDFSNIPEEARKILFKEIEIDGIKISIDDQYKFVTIMSELGEDADVNTLYSKIDEIPESIKKVVEPFMDIDAVKGIALLLVVLYLCSSLFNFIQSICMTDVANKFAKSLRSRISIKINKLPLKYFDRHQAGDTLSRVTNDVDTIAQSMNQSLGSLVSSIALFVGTIIMMFYTNWIMAITAILASLAGFAGMFLILGKSQKYFTARQTELGNLNGHIEEIYSGLNVVKVYNGKKESDEKFDVLNQKVADANQKSQFFSGIMQPLMGFIGNFGYVAVCIVGALLTMNDIISFGVIVAFISYVRLFTSPLSQIAQAMTSLQSTAAASERVFEFVDEPEMMDQKEIKRKLKKEDVKGKIEFQNVVFQYDNNDKPTINDFTATAEPGQKVAIVGPTGAGKTTMVNLLMKFYEINSGDIKIDDVSTKELTRENIHDLFTMVLQDTWLFEGTIKENIIYNRENISDEQVREVCKEVGLDHFIRTLPHGYDSKLSENDSVSAGQRQLLTIARGMIKDAPFLILDEATSNVDTRTEELVQQAMDKLTEGRTSFIIAHRLSTIKNADLILVMKDGNIIEQGNHEELMEKQGAYAELYNSQFEL